MKGEQEAEDGLMDIDFAAASEAKKRRVEETNVIDDDYLQTALSTQRRSALKKRRKMRPEDIARQMKEEDQEEAQNVAMMEIGADEGTGLVIDEASEFVAGIRKADDEERKPRRPKQVSVEAEDNQTAEEEADFDHPMNGDHQSPAKEQDEREESAPAEDVLEEKKVSMGLGATMALLKERGIVKDNENQKTHELMVQKDEFLAEKRRLEEELEEEARQERERLRRSGRFDKMTIREREEWQRQANAQRDHVKSKRLNILFNKMYNPNVEIKHFDDVSILSAIQSRKEQR
jgi:U4/U6.U5 tri-snRNP-associated protein 1